MKEEVWTKTNNNPSHYLEENKRQLFTKISNW
jgi:hypothetical protein